MSHARLSPSAAHRWIACPGSIREEMKYPDSSGAAAIDGTHTHTLLEKCLTTGNGAETYLMETLQDEDGAFQVDQDRVERVKSALGYIYARQTGMGGPVALRAESRVDPGLTIGRNDCTGTADCILISNTELEIIDYKDGMSPVSAQDNWQMILYAIGTLNEYPGVQFAKVRTTIIQPKLAMKGMPVVSYAEYDMYQIAELVEQFRLAAAKVDDPNAPLIPGDSQCKWCRHKGNCSALATKALGDAQVMFEQVDMAQQSADQDPNDLSDEKIAEIMEAAPLIKSFLEEVAKEAYKRLDSGKAITGLKLVHGRGSRGWSMDEEEIAGKLKRMGVPKDVIYPAKLISVAQVAKAKWTKKVKGEEMEASLSERQLKKIEENYVTKSKGKLKVALESEPGEAVVKDAATLFADVKTETAPAELPAWLQ